MRYAYGLTSALLVGGAAATLIGGFPAGAQVAQNDDSHMARVVPRAGAPASFADLTEQLQPAVVNISTRQRVEVDQRGNSLAELFGLQQRGQPAQPQTREAQSLGSGFIISADGYVVTNNHVIAPQTDQMGRARGTVEKIMVTLADGKEYDSELVGADPASDLAVLKIKSNREFPFGVQHIAADTTTILTVVVDAISVLKSSHLDAMRKEGANMNVDVVLHRYQSL